MYDHACKGAYDYNGVNVSERAVALALAHIAAQEFIQVCDDSFPEHLGELVTFERGVCEQSKEFRVLLVMKHHAKRKCLEDSAVVTALDGVVQKNAWVSHAAVTCFLI